MRVLDLFSGIGGFSLGLERAGMRTVAFCEVDAWCRRVLKRHWPHVPAYEDVRELTAARLVRDGIGPIDLICGGFPCQDISLAGAGAGLDGERSGLWREFARLIGDVRPGYAIVENVGALRGRGLAAILGDLAALGYDAQWHAIPAAAIGAPHFRDRVWIIAVAADADAGRCELLGQPQHTDEQGTPGPEPHGLGAAGRREGAPHAADTAGERLESMLGLQRRLARAFAQPSASWDGPAPPALRRVDDGVPARLDRPRLAGLGNAVVPIIPEAIGRAIMHGRPAC